MGIDEDPGASTLFREYGWVGGYIDDIGWDNIPRGAILGKLKNKDKTVYSGETFDFNKIDRHGPYYYVTHTGVFDSYDSLSDKVFVHQSTSSEKYNGAVLTDFSVDKMKRLGWNIWMLPLALFDPDFTVRGE